MHAKIDRTTVYRDVVFSDDPSLRLDVYQPVSSLPRRPVVVFFYGGGWRNGEKKEYAFLGQTLATRGILTIVANYRLYPKIGFPDFMNDSARAVAWTVAHADQYGGDPARIFLMGHSSGAYIASLLALDHRYLADYRVSAGNIGGVIGLAGLYDFDPRGNPEYAPIFRDVASAPSVLPIDYVSRNEPPMLLLSGGKDDVVSSQNTISMTDRIRAKGGKVESMIYPDMGHIGIMLPFSPLAHNNSTVVDDVTAFVSSH